MVMALTFNPEITAGTLLVMLSIFATGIGSYYAMKGQIAIIEVRFEDFLERTKKIEDVQQRQTEILYQVVGAARQAKGEEPLGR